MLVSLWGKRWKKVHLAMFTVYIDDSGTAPEQKVAIATALIIPAKRIVALEREWDALKKREGFTSFHMAEFSARNQKSGFADWPEPKRERVYRQVRAITKKYGVAAVTFAVYKKDYDEVVPEDMRNTAGRFHRPLLEKRE
jgi:hypothetical protein